MAGKQVEAVKVEVEEAGGAYDWGRADAAIAEEESGAVAAAAQEAEGQEVQQRAALEMGAYQLGRLVCMALPECEPAFSREACRAWADEAGPALDEMGFDALNLPPWARLGLASAPMLTAVGIAVYARKRAAKPADDGGQPVAARAERPAAADPGQGVEIGGVRVG